MVDSSWFVKAPVVRFAEVARRLKSAAYARVFVYRLVKKNKLRRVVKGVYSASDDVFAVASNVFFPGYLSFLSASFKYGFTEAIPVTVSVASAKKHRGFEYAGYKIKFFKLKEMWGYHKEGDGSNTVFIADLEKLLIDALLEPKAMGNFEEVENVFKNSVKIDVEKLKEYLARLASNKVYRQTGFLLEKFKGMDLSGLMPLDKNYYSLNPFQKKKAGKLNRKWRLFV